MENHQYYNPFYVYQFISILVHEFFIHLGFLAEIMESELNKTPVKHDIDYDYDSPVDTFPGKSCSRSPCVDWDFITPAFSDSE